MSEHAIRPGLSAGVKAGCPFCLARNRGTPKVGERVRILSEDMLTGKVGTVVENCFGIPLQPGQILLQMDGVSSGSQLVWDTTAGLLGPFPDTPLPLWALPLYLERAEEVDKFAVKFCEESIWKKGQAPHWDRFYDLVGLVWWRRLPIKSSEMWALLEAHGVPSNWKSRCTKLYQEGIALLRHVTGRKPYKTNRLYPPQYLKKATGWDNTQR